MQLQFLRLRFHFEAVDPIRFPAGMTANSVRGALGKLLLEACRCGTGAARHAADCPYALIFEPRGSGPSGFAERPRPFVLRTHHLDGCSIERGESFSFDIHLFDLHAVMLGHMIQAFARLADRGLGPGRQRIRLESVQPITLAGEGRRPVWVLGETKGAPEPLEVKLTGDERPAGVARVRFVTPTELKAQGTTGARPEFRILFTRIRDRVSALTNFYGASPLEADFRGLGERAARVEMTRCELREEHARRRSSRTAQEHSLGGFTGEAEYRGEMAEFLPYLRAARWTGVGRHTVWGKGEIQLL